MSSVFRHVSAVSLALAALPAFAIAGIPSDGTFLVSVDSSGVQGNGDSDAGRISISGDGRFVAFDSTSNNLVANDTNGALDVFVHDRMTGVTERISVSSAGVEGNGDSFYPMISANGQVVSFHSKASNLVANDTNGKEEVFIHDRVSGVTERMSVDSNGVQGNGGSFKSAISADGRFVTFFSNARNLVKSDTNAKPDVFLRDRLLGITERISVDSNGLEADDASFKSAVSADGVFVAFDSYATNLVAGDSNGWSDIFVRDRRSGVTERVSVRSSGKQLNGGSDRPSISADGRFVAFASYASNAVSGDGNGTWDVFVRDRQLGTTERVSIASSGAEGDDASVKPSISADGRYVAFESKATNLVAGDTNGQQDVFVHDRLTGETTRVSVDSLGGEANDASEKPAMSADGRFVAMASAATNLVGSDLNRATDAFVHGPYLICEARPEVALPGVTMLLDTFSGPPNNLAVLVTVDVNGTPLFVPIVFGTFDARGIFAIAGTVPNGFSGNTIGFQAFGINSFGKLSISNVATVTFQ